MKKKTNISVQDVRGIRRQPDMILGDKVTDYVSGDILDANATSKLVDNKIDEAISGVSDILDTLDKIVTELGDKADKKDLAAVATSGSYTDLSNKPTSVSDFENDANYLTEDTVEGALDGKDIKVSSITAKKVDIDLSDILISTIHIDESNSKTGSKVVITGDIAVTKNSDGDITGVKPATENVISWIKDNSRLVLGVYNNYQKAMFVKPLEDAVQDWYSDDNTDYKNASQYMQLPVFWYKCVNTDTGCDISFTHDNAVEGLEGWNKWEGKTLIGSYKANLTGVNANTIYSNNDNTRNIDGVSFVSRPDTMPATGFSWTEGRKIARNMGNGFSMVTYEAHKIMEILFYAYYGEVDSQLVCGSGSGDCEFDGDQLLNGRVLNAFDTLIDTKAEDDPFNNHFWGLSDWWGNVWELIDNIQCKGYSGETGVLSILSEDGNNDRDLLVYDVNSTQTKKMWGAYADVLPVACESYDDGYYDTGYTVSGSVLTDFGDVARRSNYSDNSYGGVGYLDVDYYPDSRDDGYGSRLLFTGSIIDVEDFAESGYSYYNQNLAIVHIDESKSAIDSKVQITVDGSDEIDWIRNNSKLYVGKYDQDLKTLLVMSLDAAENNYDSWNEDDDKNQYMKLPKFWYKCVDTTYGCDISFTHDESMIDDSWNLWDGNTFIGCYKAGLAGDEDHIATFKQGGTPNTDDIVFTSHYGSKPSTWFSWNDARTITRNMGEGFSMVTYDAHKIMEILFYASKLDVDALAVCGAGASAPSWDSQSHLNGRTMDKITNLEDTQASNKPACNHFWGLCDWWGNVWELIDNLRLLGYDENDIDPEHGENATTIGILDYDGKPIRASRGYYTEAMTLTKKWGKYADIFPERWTGDYDDFADGGYTVFGDVGTDFGYVAKRSCGSDSSDGGVGYLDVSDSPGFRDCFYGSRLLFHGTWSEVSDFN